MNYQIEKYIKNLFADAQHGVCPICSKPLTGRLSLDHDHNTGEPRGLLHQQCNLKVAQIETHTKKLNYIISRQLELRIKEYVADRHLKLNVDKTNVQY